MIEKSETKKDECSELFFFFKIINLKVIKIINNFFDTKPWESEYGKLGYQKMKNAGKYKNSV